MSEIETCLKYELLFVRHKILYRTAYCSIGYMTQKFVPENQILENGTDFCCLKFILVQISVIYCFIIFIDEPWKCMT